MMHICVSKIIIIRSDNGLSPKWRQAIIWTYAGILLIGLLRTNFSEILIEIHTFSFNEMHLKMSSAKMPSISSRPQWVKVPPNHIMTPWHGNTFHIMGFLFGESTSYQWIALTKPRASSTRLWCLLCCWPEKTVEQTINLPVIWDTMMTMWLHHDVGITSTTVKSLI